MTLIILTACQSTPPQQSAPAPVTPPPATTPNNSANAPTTPIELKIGDTIPEVKAVDMQGTALTVASRENANGALLVVYSPSCDICHATIPRWNELNKQFFTPRKIPVIGLSIENSIQTARSIRELNITFPVISMPDIDLKLGRRVKAVPTTIAVDHDGTVKWMWDQNLDRQKLVELIKVYCPECNVEINKPNS